MSKIAIRADLVSREIVFYDYSNPETPYKRAPFMACQVTVDGDNVEVKIDGKVFIPSQDWSHFCDEGGADLGTDGASCGAAIQEIFDEPKLSLLLTDTVTGDDYRISVASGVLTATLVV